MAWPEAVDDGLAKDDFNAARTTFLIVHDADGNITTLIAPSWTMGTRPGSPSTGQMGLNTDINQLEWWDGGSWRILP